MGSGARTNPIVSIQGPSGNCFYLPGQPDEPLLLAGTGTGLAPLYGIARDALTQGHCGPIWLFHGSLNPAGLYLQQELTDLAARHANFQYVIGVRQIRPARPLYPRPPPEPLRLESLHLWPPFMVNLLRKKVFLAGAA